jgi:virginiamycin A acetyltransferase
MSIENKEVDSELIKRYGISRIDALLAQFYAAFHERGGIWKPFRLATSHLFRRAAKKYKKGSPFDFGNLERFFCERYFGFSVGKYSYGTTQFCRSYINIESIGAFCSFAPGISITGINHPMTEISTHPFLYRRDLGYFIDRDRADLLDPAKNGKVVFGNDVWIGQDVIILPSVAIGNGAIVGAGSVVTKDVPDYAVVAGNPARVIRYRFNDEEIAKLNQMRWWDWEDEQIAQNMPRFTDAKAFFTSC